MLLTICILTHLPISDQTSDYSPASIIHVVFWHAVRNINVIFQGIFIGFGSLIEISDKSPLSKSGGCLLKDKILQATSRFLAACQKTTLILAGLYYCIVRTNLKKSI